MADNKEAIKEAKPAQPPQRPQHPPKDSDAPAPAVGTQNRVVEPLKSTGSDSPFDAAKDVNDPTSGALTNAGPTTNEDRPSLPRPPGSGVSLTRNMPNQPVIPPPSEHVTPGPVGRPDPSREPEEREQVRDAAIEAHALKPGHMQSWGMEGQGKERTSDGEPDDSQPPKPLEE